MPRRNHDFQSVRSEGGLLPPDLLRRILDPREQLAGTRPEDYGLPQGERLNEVITQCWNRLRRHWAEFRGATGRGASSPSPAGMPPVPTGEAAALTGLTNDKWSLPLLRELGFGVLTTGAAPEIDGRTYAISRFFASTPIHLVGCGLSLDRRTAGARGAAAANPHGLVQEFLNRSPSHLWGIVSNGLRFRILRDSQALSRQSYLEFDLEAMFDGELYADFVLVWLVAHATRFVARDGGRPETCRLEEWTKLAEEQGTRALGDLRQGVEQALQILGQGLVGHPRNTVLREALRTGQLPLNDFHGQLLRVVYRLIFLFVAEDRVLEGKPLLHAPDDTDSDRIARERYAAYYSTGRLRELASRLKGSRHGDLWQQFHLVVGALSTDARFAAARQHLALPILGGFLWNSVGTAALNPSSLTGDEGAELANADFLDVIRHLAFTRQGKVLRPVDYKNLGSEELGGVYESLLALTPQIGGDGARFTFAEFAGNERKTSGSYYTPDSLVQCLLDSALDPVVEEAIKGTESRGAAPAPSPGRLDSPDPSGLEPSVRAGADAVVGIGAHALTAMGFQRDVSLWQGRGDGVPITPSTPEQRILALKVCDPACGSGHFLVGAAHRLARHLARVRALAQGESEPSPSLYQHALRDVIGHCLYGVDINPMAVELCRVSLWLEAMEPGKPLSFLDHHIQCGNSLLGTIPELIAQGIPDDAFKAIEGDDRKACTELKKRNKAECKEIGGLFVAEDAANAEALRSAALAVDEMPDETPEAVQQKADAFAAARTRYDYLNAKRLADTWCAAFVIEKRFPPSPIDARFQSPDPFGITQRHIVDLAQGRSLPAELAAEVERLAGQYQFFHWHLAFPDVFAKGGFDCVLGNPPWEHVEAKEIEFFGSRAPEIATAQNAAARKKLIDALPLTHPDLWLNWQADKRRVQGEMHLARASGRYPLCARGRINVYALFAEHNWWVLAPRGRAGFIVPSGIATDDTTKDYFQAVTKSGALRTLWEFENRRQFFPAATGGNVKFALVTLLGPGGSSEGVDFVFQARELSELADPTRHFTLSAEDIATINPNTGTCPIFQTKRDASIALTLYRRAGVLWREGDPGGNPWGLRFMQGLFNMASDSALFRTRSELGAVGWRLDGNRFVMDREVMFPLYEAKMTCIYNHRSGTFEESASGERQHRLPTPSDQQLADPSYAPLPCYWVDRREVDARLEGVWNHDWLLGWRDITDARTVARTVISSVIPCAAVADTFLLALPSVDARAIACLYANLCSLPFDYAARQKVGGLHLKYHVFRQLPALPPHAYGPLSAWDSVRTFRDWILPRVLELTYTTWDLQPFAEDCGDNGTPFIWDADRRFHLQCEIDAAFFHLYGIARDDVDYILDTFPVLQRSDERAHGEYRTKRVVLELYDALGHATATGQPYVSTLPPPRRAACMPQLVAPNGPRIAASNPAIYTAQAILWLLKQSGGRCERVRLARAFALLSRPDWLAELAPEMHRAVAGQWRQCFSESGYDGLFRQVLSPMLGTEIVLRREGETVYAELAQPDRLLDRPWIAFDARLALAVLDSLPASVLASTPMEQAREEAERVFMAG